ncbi:MAG TPA: hypothetical protein VF762_23005 [Blastocatellia bacterium]|jgi:hypothetical protein
MKEEKKNLVDPKRNETKIAQLQKKKVEARDRLRAARLEMKRLDLELINVGASAVDLQLACW